MLKRSWFILVCLSISLFVILISKDAYSLSFYDGGYDDTGFLTNHIYIKFSPFEYLDPYSGNLLIKDKDLTLPGNGNLNLEITRIYNSKQKFIPQLGIWKIPEGSFGFSWDFFFARIVPFGRSSLPEAELTMSDGSVYEVYRNNNSNINKHVSAEFIADNFSALEYNESDDIWMMTLKNGTVYTFDHQVEILGAPAGVYYYPTSIKDTNGNEISIEYYDCCNIESPDKGGTLGKCPDSNSYLREIPHISRVIDSTGRKIKFNWLNNSCRSINSPNVISSIDLNGKRFNYKYQPVYIEGTDKIKNYLLTEVEPPEGPSWKYGYEFDQSNPNGELSMMVLSSGGKIDYKYKTLIHDPGDYKSSYQSTVSERSRVLVSRNVTGPDLVRSNWKLQYGFSDNLNTTTLIYPCGNYEVFHFYTALKNSFSGKWAVSLLYEKDLFDNDKNLIQSINRSWSPYQVSTNPSTIDNGFFLPLLTKKLINRDGIIYTTEYLYNKFYNYPTQIVENRGITGQLTRTTQISYFDNTEDGKYIIAKPETIKIGIGSQIKTIKYQYNKKTGRKLSQSIYGVKTVFSHYSDGNLEWKKNAKNIFTHYGDFKYGKPQVIKYGCNTKTAENPVYTKSRVINWGGTVRSEKNGRGYKTNYKYDGLNRLTEIKPPQGGEANTYIVYDNYSGRNVKIKKGGLAKTYKYDGLGRLVGTFSKADIRTKIQYDKCGRIIYRSFPFKDFSKVKGNTFTYDSLGRILEILHPDDTKISYQYKENSLIVNDERNFEQIYNFKSFGDPTQKRLIGIIDSDSNTTSYKYDVFGNIIEIKSPLGNMRKYVYGSNNFLLKRKEPETGTTIYKHDQIGNITSKHDSNGEVILYKYDSLNRLKKVIHPLDEEDVSYSYDNEDNILSVKSSSGSYKYLYKYDPSNRLIKKSVYLDNNLVNYKIKYLYDENNNLNEISYPSGRNINYRYDNANRIAGVLDEDNNFYLGKVIYDPTGIPLHYETAYGIISDFTYDVRRRLKNLIVSRPYPELRVIKKGLGSGRVNSVNINGINCGNDCRQVYPGSDMLITLNAVESKGSNFVNWSGDTECNSKKNSISIMLNRNKTCVAIFAKEGSQKKLSIKKNGKGDGSVLTDPEGILCGSECEANYKVGSDVVLKAIPDPYSSFSFWSGDKDCIDGSVTLDEDMNCVANFKLPKKYDLVIDKNGLGNGEVISKPLGINCGNDCEEEYEENEKITLTAKPSVDSEFEGWFGDSDCKDGIVFMTSDINCTARFKKIVPNEFILSVSKAGNGRGDVKSYPSGITCGLDCQSSYISGRKVKLEAAAAGDSRFRRWKGDPDCFDGLVDLNSNKTCIAVFELISNKKYKLNINKIVPGAGVVISSIPGINCGDQCEATYDYNTVLRLIATPEPGYIFKAWSGDIDCLDGEVKIVSDTTCTPLFDNKFQKTFNLRINKEGDGSGTVTTIPDGILCGSDCQESYYAQSEIKLEAKADDDSEFVGWNGDNDCSDGIVNIDSDKLCIAEFKLNPVVEGYILEVKSLGTGTGTVTSDIGNIKCGEDSQDLHKDCVKTFEEGSIVNLTATEGVNTKFNGWEGYLDCMDGVVTMNSDMYCVAYFKSTTGNKYSLSINSTGKGFGYVSTEPAGISCGMDCSENIYENKYITLHAVANKGSVFNGWQGNADCEDGLIRMVSDIDCDPVFDISSNSTDPGITVGYTPRPNSDGWYGFRSISPDGNVDVEFRCEDNSGSGLADCSAPLNVSDEGIHNIKGVAIDNEGNSSTIELPVRIDLTKPSVEITNYDNYDVAKLTEVMVNSYGAGIATIKGDISDSLSGPSKVFCNVSRPIYYRILNDSKENKLSEDMNFNSDIRILNNSEFECDVELYEGENNVDVYAYDKAGNYSKSGTIHLTYYGYSDTTPPDIESVSINTNYCYNSASGEVSVSLSLLTSVSDDLSGPDFDSDDLTLQDFPIDIDFDCTYNGTGTSLCSGDGDNEADNIYGNSRFITNYNTRQIQGVYEISDRNGNLASQPIELELPPLEELELCQQ